jgi:hypothetical protein
MQFDDFDDLIHFAARSKYKAYYKNKKEKNKIEIRELKHGHQRHLKPENLEKFAEKLIAEKSKIDAAKTFEELYEIIKKCGDNIHGVGGLAIYDVSVRIGSKNNVSPTKIYMDSGTRIGAEAILEKRITTKFTEKNLYPLPFQNENIAADDLEGLFCVCKKILGKDKINAAACYLKRECLQKRQDLDNRQKRVY